MASFVIDKKENSVAVWEEGGAYTNTGFAIIVADKNGYPKRPVKIRTSGSLACAEHALIPVVTGDIIITVDRHRDRVSLVVERIVSTEDLQVELEPCDDRICVDAIHAAIAKADDYHCRKPYYIKVPNRD